jgi:hypothetical protein
MKADLDDLISKAGLDAIMVLGNASTIPSTIGGGPSTRPSDQRPVRDSPARDGAKRPPERPGDRAA